MDRELATPALVLLDEVGTGTDPNEGGALATAIVNHFKQRGALVIATTHYDALKTWGTATDGVMTAAFAFDPQTFAPTYKLIYGAPGRSLAIEIAQRLGMPLPVVAAARGFLSDDQKRLAAHLARVDAQARALESDRSRLQRDRRAVDEAGAKLARARARRWPNAKSASRKRLNEKLDDRVRQARRDIDEVIEQLKERSEALIDTGVAGAAKAEAATGDRPAPREPMRARRSSGSSAGSKRRRGARQPRGQRTRRPTVGARVAVGGLGMEGTVVGIQGQQAEIDVRGKRLRAPLQGSARASARRRSRATPHAATVRVNVDLKPREGSAERAERHRLHRRSGRRSRRRSFSTRRSSPISSEIRIVHGHGTGQLRKGLAAYLKDHPLVAKFYAAPQEQGGGGATIVELKE